MSVLGLPTTRDVGLRSGPRHLDRLLGTLAGLDLDEERLPSQSNRIQHNDRVGRVVIRPDRSQHIGMTGNAWFFTGSQLADLKQDKEGYPS